MYKKIGEYGIVGNFHSVALVGLDGSIDWLCFPHLYSPSIFGALLDDKKGGRFSITPVHGYDSVARYISNTNVLTTSFRTRTGVAALVDFMTIPYGPEEEREKERHELYRLVVVINGKIDMHVVVAPRFNYAQTATVVEKQGSLIIARGDAETLFLTATHELSVADGSAEAEWSLSEGERAWLHVRYGINDEPELDVDTAERALTQTVGYWRSWLRGGMAGCTVSLGQYQNKINRSALTLKLLYYYPKGTIAAAATTSLPEDVGGVRNWDYRFTWIRDTFFTLEAFFSLGYMEEAKGYFDWIKDIVSRCGSGLQSLYHLNGNEEVNEQELTYLEGYKGSRPVRVGNGAAGQVQLDIYGELMSVVAKYSELTGSMDKGMWPSLHYICEYVIDHWREPDYGIWEARIGMFHYVYSKVMCWAALNQGISMAERFHLEADLTKWKKVREEIKSEILEKGWNEKKKAFAQHYETDALDASNLRIPVVGFLPYDDPRIISTIEATQKELTHKECFLYRYLTDDGLPGREGTFLVCTFWLIYDLIALKRFREAELYIRRMESVASHLGLFSEEYDLTWDEALGNFPQAYTHIGYIDCILALCKAQRERCEEVGSKK